MKKLEKLFNKSMEAYANNDLYASEKAEMKFYKEAEKMGYTFKEASAIWLDLELR